MGSDMGDSPRVRPGGAVRDVAGMRRALLRWYRRNRRDLPWRRTNDPYRVWVSEIMLQQTQVATATPYYVRFVARFPSVRSLARAPLDRVLAAWSGLGYYRRARHLHEAAGIVVREHAGRIPPEPGAFGALPGVGRYTLGAVLSMGFGVSLPVLDGNVARVLARLAARPWSIKRAADARALWALAGTLLSRTAPGEWNQALMELGATVCTPRAPRCGECPVRAHCRALALGRAEDFPPAAPRRAVEPVRRAIALVERAGRTLIVRRSGPLLDGLWEPPGVELARGEPAGPALGRVIADLGVRGTLAPTREIVRHAITHRDIRVEVWRGKPAGRLPRSSSRIRWIAPGERELALTSLARRVLTRPDRSRRS
jgi:A/G-specific adenine glycosylase